MNSYCSLENIFFWTLSNICNSVREHYFMRQLQTKWHIFRWSLFYNELVFACYNYYAPYEWIYFQQTTHRVTYVKLHSFELNWLFVLWIKFTVCALNWIDCLCFELNWLFVLWIDLTVCTFVLWIELTFCINITFIANSWTLSPAQTGWVWASTNPIQKSTACHYWCNL